MNGNRIERAVSFKYICIRETVMERALYRVVLYYIQICEMYKVKHYISKQKHFACDITA